MKRVVRFGIVGCGVIASTHADAINLLEDGAVTACCDVVPERAFAFAKKYGIPSDHVHTDLQCLLSDVEVDAVTVCTPSGTHARIGADCLWAGKPVIVEKPMDVNLDAIALLNAAQKETGLTLAVISQHRFDAATLYAQRLISGGYLGQLVLCEAQVKWHRSQEYYDSGDWRGTWGLDGGGALMNQGVHTVDLMRWLMGPIHSVYAVARTLAHRRIEVEDTLCATLNFVNGAIGNLVASTAVFPGYPAQLSVHGTNGSIVISGDALSVVNVAENLPDDDETARLLTEGIAGHAVDIAQGGTRFAESRKDLPPTGGALSTWGDAHRAQFADFIECIRTGSRPHVDGQAGREAVEVIIAAYESARSGKPILIS